MCFCWGKKQRPFSQQLSARTCFELASRAVPCSALSYAFHVLVWALRFALLARLKEDGTTGFLGFEVWVYCTKLSLAVATFSHGGVWRLEPDTSRGLELVWYVIRLEFLLVRG